MTDRLAVVVHGVSSSPDEMEHFSEAIAPMYKRVIVFKYDWKMAAAQAAKSLNCTLNCIDGEFDLYGHSYGGIVSRYAIEILDGPAPLSLVTLATPHSGTQLNELRRHRGARAKDAGRIGFKVAQLAEKIGNPIVGGPLLIAAAVFIAVEGAIEFVSAASPEAFKDMDFNRETSAVRKLAEGQLRAGVRYLSIAHRCDSVVSTGWKMPIALVERHGPLFEEILIGSGDEGTGIEMHSFVHAHAGTNGVLSAIQSWVRP